MSDNFIVKISSSAERCFLTMYLQLFPEVLQNIYTMNRNSLFAGPENGSSPVIKPVYLVRERARADGL